MNKLLILFILLSLISCKYESIDGPSIEFLDIIGWNDTIDEDNTAMLIYEGKAGNSSIVSSAIYKENVLLFDTVFPTPVSTCEIHYECEFLGDFKSQNIIFEVVDQNKLFAQQTKTVYINSITSPKITLDSLGIFKDSIISTNSNYNFYLNLIRGGRDIDSLYIYNGTTLLESHKVLTGNLDTVLFTYNVQTKLTDTISYKFKAIDIIGKSGSKTTTVTIIE